MCYSEGSLFHLEVGSHISLPCPQPFANSLSRYDCCMRCLQLFPGQMLELQRKKRSSGSQVPSQRKPAEKPTEKNCPRSTADRRRCHHFTCIAQTLSVCL